MADANFIGLIMDLGSGSMKLGFSNEEVPKVIEPTVFTILQGFQGDKPQLYFGQEAVEKRELPGLKSLLIRGAVTDFNSLRLFLESTYNQAFGTTKWDRPVLANYSPTIGRLQKEKQAQIFFESFNVPQYFAATNALLVLYSSGKTSGVVLDSGHELSNAVPIIDGSPSYYNQAQADFGGADLTSFLHEKIPGTSLETAKEIKEKYCRISLDFEKEYTSLAGL